MKVRHANGGRTWSSFSLTSPDIIRVQPRLLPTNRLQSESDFSFVSDTLLLCVQPGSGDANRYSTDGRAVVLPQIGHGCAVELLKGSR